MLADVKAFFRAVWWGAVASGGWLLVITVPIGLWIAVVEREVEGLWLTVTPLLISGVLTLAGAAVIGLPFTYLLYRLKAETAERYIYSGMLLGAALPLPCALPYGIPGIAVGAILSLFGLLAGTFSGNIWGEWRTRHREEA